MRKQSKTPRAKLIKGLRDEADKLYQLVVIKLKPESVISGEPTEVAHHFIPKSQSNNLRYDFDNGVPLTNKEHSRHHLSGDPKIVAGILEKMGGDWFNSLQVKRNILCKLTVGYLENKVEQLLTDLQEKLGGGE